MDEQKPKSAQRHISDRFHRLTDDSIQEYHALVDLVTEKCEAIPTRFIRRSVGIVATTAAFSVPVAAQATQEAGDVMCSSGLGPVITLAFGMITMGMFLLAAFRGAMAWLKMGSARSDKKKEGRDAARGAVITFCGAWFFPLFAVVLDKAGVSTLSCVNFANIM
ncbi:hypothetical protein NKF26_23435 [Haladaptatus sp. AB618]|uniref:hypothetical protein n=1 Tax=Haladaptatus sp. AB618 TaxID=2934173 RepID=UPI00209C0171|nr:hypothetical protein [Haladaptatus sp. AB618]MCO8256778.1 hypothetical protein [Haladaptatus sp. AB618]